MNSKPQRCDYLKWGMVETLKKSARDSLERTRHVTCLAEEIATTVEREMTSSGCLLSWKITKTREQSDQAKKSLENAERLLQYAEKTEKNVLPRPGRTRNYRFRMTHLVRTALHDVLTEEIKVIQFLETIMAVQKCKD